MSGRRSQVFLRFSLPMGWNGLALLLLTLGVASLTAPFATPARASLGGPSYIEMLGWKPKESKIFFTVRSEDEGGDRQGVYYLDLNARDPNRAQRVSWSVDSSDSRNWKENQAKYQARLMKLRRELAVLPRLIESTFPQRCEVIQVDSLRNMEGPWARYRVRIADGRLGNDRLLLTCYREPSVRFIDHYSIPGRAERVEIVSFIGKPHEIGYEVQAPVVIRPKEDWEARDTVEVRIPGSRP